MGAERVQVTGQGRQQDRIDLSRFLPLLGILIALVGVAVFCMPTRDVVLCDDAPEFHHFESLYRTMWHSIVAAFLVSLLALVTLFIRRRRTWVTFLRSAFLAAVVSFVLIQALVGSEVTRLGMTIFESQTCDEPGAFFLLPNGILQP